MDIFNYAKEFDADYYDSKTGFVYLVQNYNRSIRLGLPVEGIEVCDLEGNYIGIVRKES